MRTTKKNLRRRATTKTSALWEMWRLFTKKRLPLVKTEIEQEYVQKATRGADFDGAAWEEDLGPKKDPCK